MIHPWLNVDEPAKHGQPGYEVVYWRGARATSARPITQRELEVIRWRGVWLLRWFGATVLVLGLATAEALRSLIQSGSALGVLLFVGAAALGALAFAVYRQLIPALRCGLVPVGAQVLTFAPRPATAEDAAQESADVVVPGGVVLAVGGRSLRAPRAERVAYVAPPAKPPKKKPVKGRWRDLTSSELAELQRGLKKRRFASMVSLCAFGGYAVLNTGQRIERADYWFAGIMLVVSVFLLLYWLRGINQESTPTRVFVEATPDGGPDAWTETLDGEDKLWTVNGEPAKWRLK